MSSTRHRQTVGKPTNRRSAYSNQPDDRSHGRWSAATTYGTQTATGPLQNGRRTTRAADESPGVTALDAKRRENGERRVRLIRTVVSMPAAATTRDRRAASADLPSTRHQTATTVVATVISGRPKTAEFPSPSFSSDDPVRQTASGPGDLSLRRDEQLLTNGSRDDGIISQHVGPCPVVLLSRKRVLSLHVISGQWYT